MDPVAQGERHSRNEAVLHLFGNHLIWCKNVEKKKKQYNMLYITQSTAGLLINKTFTVQSCHISTLPFPKVYVDEVRLHRRVRGEEGRHAATLYPGVHYV